MKNLSMNLILIALSSFTLNSAQATTATDIEFQPITAFGNTCSKNNVFPTDPGYFADYGSPFDTAKDKTESKYSSYLYTATESGWIDFDTQKPISMTQVARFRGFGSYFSNPDRWNVGAQINTSCNQIVSEPKLANRYHAFLYMQNQTVDGAWKIQLPSGKYTVQLVAGDPYFTGENQNYSCRGSNPHSYLTDTFAFDVNGTPLPLIALLNQIDTKSCDSSNKNCDLLVDPKSIPETSVQPTGCNFSGYWFWGTWDCTNSRLWFKGTETVTVTATNSDGTGYIVVSNHHDSKGNLDSYNNKINFINITPVAPTITSNFPTVGGPIVLPTLPAVNSSTTQVTDLIELNGSLTGIGSVNDGLPNATTKPVVWIATGTAGSTSYPTATDLDPALSFTDSTISSEVPMTINSLGDILGLVRFYEPNTITPQSELVVWHPNGTTGYKAKIVLPFLQNSDITSSFVENGKLLSNGDVVGDAYGIFTDSYALNGTESYFRATLYWKENADGSYQAPVRFLTNTISNVYFSTLATVGANGNIFGSVVFLPNYNSKPVVWIKNASGTYNAALDIGAAAGNIGANSEIYQSAFENKYFVGAGNELVIQDNDGGFGNPQYYMVTPSIDGSTYNSGTLIPSLSGSAINQIYLANYVGEGKIFEYAYTNSLDYFGVTTKGVFSTAQTSVPFPTTEAPLYDGEVINDNGGIILESLTNSSTNYINYPDTNGNYLSSTQVLLQNPPNFGNMVITNITDNAIYGQATSGGVTLPVVWLLTTLAQ